MRQTAVEWLMQKMMHTDGFNPYIEQAKEMERQQIIEAYIQGSISLTAKAEAEQYYNETFKK
jgi:hypothetical protein